MSRSRRRKHSKLFLVGIAAILVVGGGLAVNTLFRSGTSAASPAVTTPGQRNNVRKTGLKLISDALSAYTFRVGKLPVRIPDAQTSICSGNAAACKATGLVDLGFLISSGDINSIPTDPVGGHERYATGYRIGHNAKGQLELTAPRAENGADITITVK